MITKKEFSQALTDNASVAAGLISVSPLYYAGDSLQRVKKIEFGFTLNHNESLFLIYEPNSRTHLLFSITRNHSNQVLIFSKSEGNMQRSGIYIEPGNTNSFYIEITDWSKILLFPGTLNKRIKEAWNPTITDVTESFDPSSFTKIW